jgi:putative Holliday junction resolvase
VVGVDLGSVRVGIAVSDPTGTLASPYEVVPRGGDLAAKLRAIIDEVGATLVVVGLPLSMDGSVGRAAQAAIDEAASLGEALPVPVETFDERLTTVTADRSLMAFKMKADARRRVVDKVAAAVMLQAWLDSRETA